MILQSLTEGFLLGLSTGLVCLATCGPIYSPFLMQRQFNLLQSLIALFKISAGRFITYILFGLIAGLLGQQIDSINREWFTSIAYILFSVILFVSAFRTHRKEQGCQLKKWGAFIDNPFMLGIVTGINYCPAFLIAITRAVDLSGPLSGAMLFFAFFFGTSIYLLPLSLFGVMGNKKILRTIAVIASVLIGTFFIFKALDSIIRRVAVKNEIQREYDKGNVIGLLDSTHAYLLSEDTSSFDVVRKVLSTHKKGGISFASDTSQITRTTCYLFVDSRWNRGNYYGLQQKNRFVLILPAPAQESGYDATYGNSVVQFLDRCYFKWNREHGGFHSMPKSRIITKQVEKKLNRQK
jgi:sulfite exporter TauE/SafE